MLDYTERRRRCYGAEECSDSGVNAVKRERARGGELAEITVASFCARVRACARIYNNR